MKKTKNQDHYHRKCMLYLILENNKILTKKETRKKEIYIDDN